MFRFKLVLIVHFLSVCVVSAVASSERVGLSTISPLEAAMMKIDEHRIVIINNNGYYYYCYYYHHHHHHHRRRHRISFTNEAPWHFIFYDYTTEYIWYPMAISDARDDLHEGGLAC